MVLLIAFFQGVGQDYDDLNGSRRQMKQEGNDTVIKKYYELIVRLHDEDRLKMLNIMTMILSMKGSVCAENYPCGSLFVFFKTLQRKYLLYQKQYREFLAQLDEDSQKVINTLYERSKSEVFEECEYQKSQRDEENI